MIIWSSYIFLGKKISHVCWFWKILLCFYWSVVMKYWLTKHAWLYCHRLVKTLFAVQLSFFRSIYIYIYGAWLKINRLYFHALSEEGFFNGPLILRKDSLERDQCLSCISSWWAPWARKKRRVTRGGIEWLGRLLLCGDPSNSQPMIPTHFFSYPLDVDLSPAYWTPPAQWIIIHQLGKFFTILCNSRTSACDMVLFR